VLFGREKDCQAIDQLVSQAQGGKSGTLVIRGEPGIGKSALLEYARRQTNRMTVLRATGVESEAELPFAALHQLLHPLLDRLKRLPTPQAQALEAAFGLRQNRSDDRFLIGAGVLSLLADAAEEKPLVCLIDDAHWLDRGSAEALQFAARRLEADAVVLLFTTRTSGFGFRFAAAGLPEVHLVPLTDAEAREVLADHYGGKLAYTVRDRVIQCAAGNPLALLELPAALSEAQCAGREPLPPILPLTGRIEDEYFDRIRRLPRATQTLLLLASVEDLGDAVYGAAQQLGAGPGDLEPAERAGLVEAGEGRIDFRHPLVRSAAYRVATFAQRQQAHAALADVLSQPKAADRRAWHRAAATVGTDDEVADELERTAERAHRRNGYAAASEALERSARLTSGDEKRARRLIAAAEAAWRAGETDRALSLLDQAGPLPVDPVLRGTAAEIRGLIEAQGGSLDGATIVLAEAAQELALLAPRRALWLAVLAAQLAPVAGDHQRLVELNRFVGSLAVSDTPREIFLRNLLVGMAATFGGDVGSAVEPLATALKLVNDLREPRTIAWAGDCAGLLGDVSRAHRLYARAVESARGLSAVGDLMYLLYLLALTEIQLGKLTSATACASEGLRLARDTNQPGIAAHLLGLLARTAALRGDVEVCRTFASETLDYALPHGQVIAVSGAMLALAELDLAEGRPKPAAERLEGLVGGTVHPVYRFDAVPQLVEAAVRAGRIERAQCALTMYEGWVRKIPSSSNRPLLARCQALVTGGSAADAHFEDALLLHAKAPIPFDRARTELLFGEYLRRTRKRVKARLHLQAALETFESLGARLWADRAAAELRATGQRARKRTPDTLLDLTPQELQIARLAAEGTQNREISAKLFISPKTVEYHLGKVYAKLAVASRAELGPRLDCPRDRTGFVASD
jgi:DNA-binding CsgD family transcriptional regulator